MKTFHGKQSIKDEYIKKLKGHAAADRIVKGQYWEDGKGCAVGCTIEGSDHNKYETELGIPEWIARLEDSIFEGLPNEEAMKFPIEFLEAMPVGVDKSEFFKLQCDLDYKRLAYLLDNLESDEWGVGDSIRTMMALKLEYVELDDDRYEAAESAARSAVWSASSAAESAARSAAESAARSAAESAAWQRERDNLLNGLRNMKGEVESEIVREMTVAEVSKELGCEVKIIK